MRATAYSLETYIDDLRRISRQESDDGVIIQRVKPLAARLARNRDWIDKDFLKFNESQGFGIHLLHEGPDHDLAVFLFSWLPDRGTLPHNHNTWAVVVGLQGAEEEVHYRRLDDGSKPGHAELERSGGLTLTSGDVTSCLPADIHSVRNNSQEVSLSLHTYGRHINHTGRSEFLLDCNEERPYVVAIGC